MKTFRRIPLFVGGILLLFFARPNLSGIMIGIGLITLGEAIRIWGTGHLQKNESLTVTGPYAFVKNPLYFGSILITVGFCILANNIYLLAAATLMFCFHYIPYKKKIEGGRLRRVFGPAYEDYDEKVPDYLPRWTPYSDQKASWSFRCFVGNSEVGIIFIIALGVVLILSKPSWVLLF